MSLYWPEQRIALHIVDDPLSEPFDTSTRPDVTVLDVTCAQLSNLEAFEDVAYTLASSFEETLPPNHLRHHALPQTLFE